MESRRLWPVRLVDVPLAVRMRGAMTAARDYPQEWDALLDAAIDPDPNRVYYLSEPATVLLARKKAA